MYLSNRKTRTIIKLIAAVIMLSGMKVTAEEWKRAEVNYGAADLNGIKQSLKNVFDAAQNRGTESGVTGEQGSYHVNETTGAFEYDYPIYIPKLTQGPGLDLGIHYNSQGMNGFMGLGAELTGLPSIKRDSRYDINYDNTDHFTLGGQKLIEDETKGYYRCEVEDYSYTYGGKYETGDGWKVYLQDGTEMTFGGSSDSRLTSEAAKGAVYEWKLSEIKDPKGNTVSISYSSNKNELVPEKVEFKDTGSSSASVTVKFSFRSSKRRDGYAKQMEKAEKYSYGKVLEYITVTAGNSVIRNYKFEYGYEGYGENLVLRRIKEYGSSGSENSANQLNEVVFNWEVKKVEARGKLTLMDGYTDGVWYRYDFNGDGKDDLYCITEDALYVADGNGTGSYGAAVKWADFATNGWSKKTSEIRIYGECTYRKELKSVEQLESYFYLRDYNKDGKPDLVVYKKQVGKSEYNGRIIDKYYYLENTGSGFTASNTITQAQYEEVKGMDKPQGEVYLIGSKYYLNVHDMPEYEVWYKVDFNGDGKDDLYSIAGNAFSVAEGDGTGNYNNSKMWMFPLYNINFWTVTDYNKDGKQDLIIKFNDGDGSFKYYENTGSKFSSVKNITETDYNLAKVIDVDIDGDGLSDKVRQSGGILYVKINLGKGVYADEREYGSGISGPLYGPQGGFADINRDGKLDRYQVENGTLNVFYNNGANLTPKFDLGIPCSSNIFFDDVNGNGSLELVEIKENTVTRQSINHNAAVINRVSFTAGNSVNVTYDYKKNVTESSGKLKEEGKIKREKENPLIVARIYEEDGTGHKINVTSYKYGSSFIYKENEKDIASVGFEYVQNETKTKDGNYIKVRNEYGAGSTEKEKKVLAGHPEKVTTYDEDYNKYSTVEYEYYIRKTKKDSYFVAVSAENTTLRNGKTGSGRKYYRKRYEYDTYGYVTLFNDYGEVDSTWHDIGSDLVGKEYKYITVSKWEGSMKFRVLRNESTYGYNADGKKILTGYQKYYYYHKTPIEDHGWCYDKNDDPDKVSNSEVGTKRLLAKVESYSGTLPANPASLNREVWYEYDKYGKMKSSIDAMGNRTGYEYDATYPGLISRVTYADNSSTECGYDNGGRLVSVIDGEGVEIFYEYDKFSRLSRIYQGESSAPEAEILYSYYIGKSSCGAPSCVETKVLSGNADESNTYVTSRSYYNGAGFLIQEKADAEKTGEYRTVSYEYSVSGQMIKQSNPYITKSLTYTAPDWSEIESIKYDYDEMDRLYQVTAQDGTVTGRTVYAEPGLTYSIDGKGNVSAVKTSCGDETSWPYAGEAGKLNETSYASTRSSCLGLNAALTDENLYHVTAKGYAGLSIIEETGKDGSSSVKTNTIRITLDSSGQKMIYEDPDKGTWKYEYDLNGNLTKQTDARGNITQFSYDSLNRPVEKTTKEGEKVIILSEYEYYKDGLLKKVTYSGGSDEYEYTAQKTVKEHTKTLTIGENSISKKEVMTYTKAGLPDTVTYPDGEKVRYVYKKNGNFSSLSYGSGDSGSDTNYYVSETKYNDYGALSSQTLGNGLINTRTYDSLIRCTKTGLTKPRVNENNVSYTDIFSLSYVYDACSNITTKIDSTGVLTESYTYDGRNRLETSKITSLENHTWDYDDFNNIISWAREKGPENKKVSSYTYEGLVNGSYEGTTTAENDGDDELSVAVFRHGPHAATSVSAGNGKAAYTYKYNENGDMTEAKSSGCTKTFTYNGENRMTGMTVSDGTNTNSWTYSYDADGERTVKKNNTTGTCTVYWFDNYEETYKTSGTSVALTESVKYYKVNDGTVAQRVTDKTETLETVELTYLFKDVLGSTVKVCDASGNITEFLGYEPFGKLVMRKVPGNDGNLEDGDTKDLVSKKTYTGQEPETDDGLYYYHARYYDSSIGRFIQADSVLAGLNRYCYCGNNPINFVDPDGRAPRNMTETERSAYKTSISSADVTKAPAGVVCSTYAAYNYSNAMEAATGVKDSYKNLQHDGEKLSGLWGFYASDFYNSKDGPENFSFYTDGNGNRDNSFNSSNIEVGTIGVFGTKNPDGWTGHIWTVTGVNRDKDGNVSSIDIIEGHQSSKPSSANVSAKDFQEYINGTGPFLGWGEMGKNSALNNTNNNQQVQENTNASINKD